MTFPRRTDVARHLARKPRSLSKIRPEAIPVGLVPRSRPAIADRNSRSGRHHQSRTKRTHCGQDGKPMICPLLGTRLPISRLSRSAKAKREFFVVVHESSPPPTTSSLRRAAMNCGIPRTH